MLKYNKFSDEHQCECGIFVSQMVVLTIEKMTIGDAIYVENEHIEYDLIDQETVKSWLECPCGQIYQHKLNIYQDGDLLSLVVDLNRELEKREGKDG